MKRLYIVLMLITVGCSILYAQEVREVAKTVDLQANGKVFIDTYKGSITIETWDKPQVNILARIEADGWDSEAKKSVEKTDINIDSSPGEVSIQSDYDRLRMHRSWFSGWFDDNNMALPLVHYTISMPKTARLTIKDYKSDSRISNLHSSLNFNTYKGSVTVTGLEGSIRLETYKGEINVDVAKLSDDSQFETYKGEIHLTFPRSAAFELDTELGRRAHFDSDFNAVYRSKHSSGDDVHGNVNGGGPRLRLVTEKGSFRLRAK